MEKNWQPIPKDIELELKKCVEQRYSEQIAKLPKLPIDNPDISHTASKDGFKAQVKFCWENGTNSLSLWEYTNRTKQWYMYRDWND